MDKMQMARMAKGALEESFNFELEKVLSNILDPNTEATKARKITISMTLKPNKDRSFANVVMQTKSNLVPSNSIETAITFGKDTKGNIEAAELGQEVYGQLQVDDDGNIQEGSNIVNYRREIK